MGPPVWPVWTTLVPGDWRRSLSDADLCGEGGLRDEGDAGGDLLDGRGDAAGGDGQLAV